MANQQKVHYFVCYLYERTRTGMPFVYCDLHANGNSYRPIAGYLKDESAEKGVTFNGKDGRD